MKSRRSRLHSGRLSEGSVGFQNRRKELVSRWRSLFVRGALELLMLKLGLPGARLLEVIREREIHLLVMSDIRLNVLDLLREGHRELLGVGDRGPHLGPLPRQEELVRLQRRNPLLQLSSGFFLVRSSCLGVVACLRLAFNAYAAFRLELLPLRTFEVDLLLQSTDDSTQVVHHWFFCSCCASPTLGSLRPAPPPSRRWISPS